MAIPLVRSAESAGRVTTVELFFDLVYVFAITQLADLLVHHLGLAGVTQAVVLLAMVWQVWVYTTWASNYLDPERQLVRAMLLVLMLASLVFAAALPEAFTTRGALVAAMSVGIQVGRCLFVIYALRGHTLQMAFVRILGWSAGTSVIVLLGLLAHGYVRALLWAMAVGGDLIGAAAGFYLPRLGRSATADWTISGGHFAERCQAFVLIALGESIVVIGTTLADAEQLGAALVGAFVVAFLGSVALWWVYFDHAAEDSANLIARSPDPGRLARSAFHWTHPVIIAGIVTAAAADDLVLADPGRSGQMSTAWLVLGGTALFLAGHALFKAVLWRIVSWTRVVGVAVLMLLAVLAPHVSALTLTILALAVVAGVALADQLQHRVTARSLAPAGSTG
jgi:low temperature requirement protein LtrA